MVAPLPIMLPRLLLTCLEKKQISSNVQDKLETVREKVKNINHKDGISVPTGILSLVYIDGQGNVDNLPTELVDGHLVFRMNGIRYLGLVVDSEVPSTGENPLNRQYVLSLLITSLAVFVILQRRQKSIV